MAAASTAPTTTAATSTTITSSNTHANGYAWRDSSSKLLQYSSHDQEVLGDDYKRGLLNSESEGVLSHASPNAADYNRQGRPTKRLRDSQAYYAEYHDAPENVRPDWGTDGGSDLVDGMEDGPYVHGESLSTVGSNKRVTAADPYAPPRDDENSKWIHRDKLARIESEELQAAGIVLPKTRARSKQRRDAESDTANYRKSGSDADSMSKPRSRKNSGSYSDRKEQQDVTSPVWDLRLPEEIAEESYFVPLSGTRSASGVSRIPVAKLSPVPIPQEHMERDTPMPRRRDESPEESIVYPRTRSRSTSIRASEANSSAGPTVTAAMSPSRTTARSTSDGPSSKKTGGAGSRKASTTNKPGGGGTATGRPKTRNGPANNKDSTGGGGSGRPGTRSGERKVTREVSAGASSRQPEGEPPWMISAYKPDPRLPPDQRLLPTVAKRLQQEKWEREGKFGNVFDKDFRPLTDEGFGTPPGVAGRQSSTDADADAAETAGSGGTEAQGSEKHQGWPLKPDARSPTIPPGGRAGSYSTIPKIQDRSNISPMPSPRGPLPHTSDAPVVRTPAGPTDEEEAAPKKGCGCCLVM